MYKVVKINGKAYYKGKDFEEAKVWPPSNEEPYWLIKFLIDDKVVKKIKATGQIECIEIYED